MIDLSIKFKQLKKNRIPHKYLDSLNIALIFEKTSTRTRSAFTVAGQDLGMNVTYLGAGDIQLGKKESVVDTAKVLGSMFDGIEYRGFKQEDVEDLAKYSGVPVWNGLTDTWHPTQMIADFMTLKEHFGSLEDLTIAYIGDGRNNIANSLLVTSAILGVNVKIISPEILQPEADIVELAQKHNNGANLNFFKIYIPNTSDIYFYLYLSFLLFYKILNCITQGPSDLPISMLNFPVHFPVIWLIPEVCLFLMKKLIR